jgi:ABC-type transport system involved in Fe-S cluster assembly fused permease/ATPase subunit
LFTPPPQFNSSPPTKGLKEKKIRAHFVETIHKIIWVEVFFTVFISSYRNHKKKKSYTAEHKANELHLKHGNG